MASKTPTPNDMDSYIAAFDPAAQALLQKVRACIAKAAPGAIEKMSYGMPTFFLRKNLVHFALCKSHIGFYPTPSGILNFAQELAPYVTSKGAVQFPHDKPIPYAIIAKIVRFRVRENMVGSL